MACSDYGAYFQFLKNEQFFDAVYCVFADSVGVLLFPLLVWGSMGTALYIFSGSLIMPLVLTIILGGVVAGGAIAAALIVAVLYRIRSTPQPGVR